MPNADDERLRRIAYQLREELCDVLSEPEAARPDCEDAALAKAIEDILSIEDELSAPNLARQSAEDRRELFGEIAALFLDPGGNGGESRYRDALDRSLGRWTRRKVKRVIEETSLADFDELDHEAWGIELRAMAAAQSIDRNGGDLRLILRALFVLESGDESQCPPEGAPLATAATTSETARRLLTRITTMLCERREHAG